MKKPGMFLFVGVSEFEGFKFKQMFGRWGKHSWIIKISMYPFKLSYVYILLPVMYKVISLIQTVYI